MILVIYHGNSMQNKLNLKAETGTPGSWSAYAYRDITLGLACHDE
jgi:hypothetical protein